MDIHELMDTHRWCYWLDEMQPDDSTERFRVSIVVENEPGHFPTGGGDVVPWYWDKATCRAKNTDLGLTPEDVDRIVASSMFSAGRN